MEGCIYISAVIGDTCSHHRICSPDRCFVGTPFQLCTAVLDNHEFSTDESRHLATLYSYAKDPARP